MIQCWVDLQKGKEDFTVRNQSLNYNRNMGKRGSKASLKRLNIKQQQQHQLHFPPSIPSVMCPAGLGDHWKACFTVELGVAGREGPRCIARPAQPS